MAYIYVLEIGADAPVKIGRTSNPRRRLQEIRTCSPYGASYAALYEVDSVETSRVLERSAHLFLSDLRLGNEWFDIEPRYVAAAIRGLAAHDGIAIKEAA